MLIACRSVERFGRACRWELGKTYLGDSNWVNRLVKVTIDLIGKRLLRKSHRFETPPKPSTSDLMPLTLGLLLLREMEVIDLQPMACDIVFGFPIGAGKSNAEQRA